MNRLAPAAAARALRLLATATLLLPAACAVTPKAGAVPIAYAADVAATVRAQARHGDWLVIRGRHDTDDFVATVTNMPLSHAAVYDREHDQVIEAEGVGVHATPLDAFVAKSARLMVIRPMWARDGRADAAVQRALALVGRGYDYLGLIGFNADPRYYCTELAVSVYAPERGDGNPLPPVIAPGQMYHWGTVVYDSGPQGVADRRE